MNPANNLNLAPPLHPPQPHRPSTSCDRHPEERFTGFCPSCLFDRLSVLDVTTKNSIASSSRKPPSSSSLKSIFKPSSSSSGLLLFPELRRTKSFSATKNEAFSSLGAFEPKRRSCDVKVRNTLWSLFNEDAEHHKEGCEIDLQVRDLSVKSPVFEEETEIECEKDINFGNFKEPRSGIDEIVEVIEEVEEEEETKKVEEELMETTKKPNRDFKGSFWSAASVLSKKLQRWRQKKKRRSSGGTGAGSAALPVEKSIGRQFRDTQSEIAEYGYGRRSCDTDPRFSIDAGRFSLDAGRISLDAARVSVDDPRYSFDEPRASWDGYLIGRTVAPPRIPSMLSVVEDSPVRNHVFRSDKQIPVEEPPLTPPPQPEIVPGGSAQTREYYNDSSSRRRKSLDRSSSTRKVSASVMAEIDELKLSASKTKVSPSQDFVLHSHSHSHSHSNSLRDDCSVENFEMGTGTVESSKKGTKKSKRWSWNIFGLLHRKNENKFEEERSRVDRAFSGSWNVDTRKGFDPKMNRSNSSVSWRSSGTGGGGGFQRNSVDGYVSGKKNVSSSNGRKIENELLKFYLTPSKGRRRGSSDSTTDLAVPGSNPLARNAMNFY